MSDFPKTCYNYWTMEKFVPKSSNSESFEAGLNFEREALSEIEAVARATGKTVEEVIEHNRQNNPNI